MLPFLPPLNSFRKVFRPYWLVSVSVCFACPASLSRRGSSEFRFLQAVRFRARFSLPATLSGPFRLPSARLSSLFTSTLFTCHDARCGPTGFSRERPVGGATRESILRLPKFVKHFLVFFLKNFFRTPELVKHCCCCKFSHGQPCARPAFTFLPVKAREIPSD